MLKHIGLRILSCAAVFALLSVSAQERTEEKKVMPVEKMVQSILETPVLADNSFYYDNGFRAVGSFSVHDHFAKRVCLGYLKISV
jgi:hypothetical protein